MRIWIRRAGIGAAALFGVILAAYGAAHVASERLLRRSYAHVPAPALVAGAADVARGRHLATAIGKCTECHGEDLGGKLAIDAGPVGQVIATNLTRGRGGVIGRYTDAQLARAIRSGVRHDGRGLRIMPSEDWQRMSDQDAADLIAYIRSVPPVDRDPGETVLLPLGRVLVATGQLPIIHAEHIDHTAPRPMPQKAVTVEYGRYLANMGGCTGCHRADLSGGHVPGTPPEFKDASNLTPAGPLARWSEADFFNALRRGVRPDGSRLDDFMPWRATAAMTDDEIRAVWLYLKSVPAAATREG